MKAMFYIGSKSKMNGSAFEIEGMGLTPIEARSNAIQFGRARFGISDPVVLTEHEAGFRKWQVERAPFAPKMDVVALNGHSGPCFDYNAFHLGWIQ